MEPIPRPEILDPHRVSRDDRQDMTLDDHRSQSQLLARALDESCAYAQLLWDDMDAMRRYLHECLPPDPRAPGVDLAVGASPNGPADEQGWQRWIDAYAEVTSVLCGPHGDSGYGRTVAAHEAQIRRNAPVSTLKATQPEVVRSTREAQPPSIPPSTTPDAVASRPASSKAADGHGWSLLSFTSGVAVTVGAVRMVHRRTARRRAGTW